MMSDRHGIFYEDPDGDEDEQSRAWRGCMNLLMWIFSFTALVVATVFIYLYLME